jgi:hypothetical protein
MFLFDFVAAVHTQSFGFAILTFHSFPQCFLLGCLGFLFLCSSDLVPSILGQCLFCGGGGGGGGGGGFAPSGFGPHVCFFEIAVVIVVVVVVAFRFCPRRFSFQPTLFHFSLDRK